MSCTEHNTGVTPRRRAKVNHATKRSVFNNSGNLPNTRLIRVLAYLGDYGMGWDSAFNGDYSDLPFDLYPHLYGLIPAARMMNGAACNVAEVL